MITLYHSPFTRSLLIRFALEELEIPHEIVWSMSLGVNTNKPPTSR